MQGRRENEIEYLPKTSTPSNRFIHNVRKICLKNEMPMQDICSQIGLSRNYFSYKKYDGTSVSLDVAYKVSKILGKEMEELIDG